MTKKNKPLTTNQRGENIQDFIFQSLEQSLSHKL